jgi:hypothetical protein
MTFPPGVAGTVDATATARDVKSHVSVNDKATYC